MDGPPIVLTTDPGLEEVVVGELLERFPGAVVRTDPCGRPGQVRVERVPERGWAALRTIHHVVELRAETATRTLDDVRDVMSRVAIDELTEAESFRVSSVCRGRDDIDRLALQGAAGAVLQTRYGTRVDLEGFALEVRVDLDAEQLAVGIQLTREPLGKRIRRGGALRSSLKATTAAAMVRLAGAHRGAGRLVDPMCGAAVIPVEAAAVNPALAIDAADWDERTVEAARATLAHHALDVEVRRADARSLGDDRRGWFDAIVTDPPHGMRQARRTRLGDLYRDLLVSFERALVPEGRIVIVVVKHRLFEGAIAGTGLRVIEHLAIGAGEFRQHIFVLVKDV